MPFIYLPRDRGESGGINVGKYAVDIASSNYVCTMGDTQSIDCHMTPSGSGINCYFNNGNVTGDIYLTFYLEDVLYYFYITDKTNDSDLRPQLSMDIDKYFIDTIHIIKTISNFKSHITHPVLTLSISHDDNNNIINKIKYFIITSQYHYTKIYNLVLPLPLLLLYQTLR